MSTQQKIALVTGATRGIGLETVRQLAASGAHVLLAGRDRARAVEATLRLQSQGLPVEAIALDITDADSIDAAAKEVERRHGRLDILVNNAGIQIEAFGAAASASTPGTWRQVFDTNLFGTIAVTQAFLPLLRKSAAGRIVNVSSILGSLAINADAASPLYGYKLPAYNTSKAALNAWTLQLAYELKDGPIKVNAVHPGYVKTDMNAGEGELDASEGAETSVAMALLGDEGPNGTFQHRGEVLPW